MLDEEEDDDDEDEEEEDDDEDEDDEDEEEEDDDEDEDDDDVEDESSTSSTSITCVSFSSAFDRLPISLAIAKALDDPVISIAPVLLVAPRETDCSSLSEEESDVELLSSSESDPCPISFISLAFMTGLESKVSLVGSVSISFGKDDKAVEEE